eukprot:CAMPEP_0183324662 /NCGR_PEP_ID=MMETSP0160_2-20130417/77590_1 /TAXON_ID=2839 ORGANISM="Odontella Sinensis, Strain Grunow 1884" /NCGR_SAMPLE_ID=MMETSP0160_2 /ASSEMBLY_ACC=CAM_ASM_000250 /LENGTH=291 /DNA_ID=CAMNT_0025492285 /DNA_START=195 /DNA_END=1067 /DNA_ORIENTATION=-
MRTNQASNFDASNEGSTVLNQELDEPFTSDEENSSNNRRMVYWSLSIYLLVFLTTTILVLLPGINTSLFLGITLVGIGMCGGAMSLTGTGVTAVAALFPPEAGITWYFSGQATGALAVAIANFVTASAESLDKYWAENCPKDMGSRTHDTLIVEECPSYNADWATFAYFGLGCLFLFSCIIGYYFLDQYININQQQCSNSQTNQDIDPIRVDPISGDASQSAEEHDLHTTSFLELADYDIQTPLINEDNSFDSSHPTSTLETAGDIWLATRSLAISVFVTLFIAITITPAW